MFPSAVQWVNIKAPKSSDTFAYDISLDENGDLSGSLKCSFKGYYAIPEREEYREDKTGKHWFERFKDNYPEIELKAGNFENLNNPNKPFKEKIELNIPEAAQQAAKNTLTQALQALDTGWLADSKYLCGEQLTLADFAAYVEIGQLRTEFTNVYTFEAFPNVQRWLDDMKQVPGHDDVHTVLAELGDISQEPPSMETVKNANKMALKRLTERLNEM